MAAARRLRGELVRVLRDQPLRAPWSAIRLAELTLDSDQAPDVELLVTAARDAIALTNITLGERRPARRSAAVAAWTPANCWPAPCCGRVEPPNPRRRWKTGSTPTP